MSLQHIKQRIKSIRSTSQITKAMELVSAAKMRKAQAQAQASRPYALHGREIIEMLSGRVDRKKHALLANRKVEKIALIVISSDKGLAGSYNTLLTREVAKFIKENQDKKIDIITVGKKGEKALLSLGFKPTASFADIATHPNFSDIIPIGKIAIDGFIDLIYDQVIVAYTHFHSTIKQEAKVAVLLPINGVSPEGKSGSQAPQEGEAALPRRGREAIEDTSFADGRSNLLYKFEPNQDKVLDFILPRMIETNFYQFLLEAIASEHSARMVAMKNASDNASDIIGDLTLTYNSARQAKITQELLEITGAAEAIS